MIDEMFKFAGLAACAFLAVSAHAEPLKSYGPYPEQTYETCGKPSSATAVGIMHGGWDVGGGADTLYVKRLCTYLASRGAFVVAFNYRLVTVQKYQWPAQWQDAQLMVRWLRGHGHARVGIVGLSAGGYNVLGAVFERGTIQWKTVDPRNEAGLLPAQSSSPDFAVAVSPFSNLNDPVLLPSAVDRLVRGQAPVNAGFDRATRNSIASPITHVRPDIPPLLVIHGKNDSMVPVAESEALFREMQKIGGNMRLDITMGDHIFGGYTDTGLQRMLNDIGDCVMGLRHSFCRSGK